MTASSALRDCSPAPQRQARPAPHLKVACASCGLHQLCLPMGLTADELARLDLIYTRRSVAKGQYLYWQGDDFGSIYAIRLGYFKTTILYEDGRDQVTGFHMAGEVLGLDGICTEQYTLSALALEDSEVCVVQFSKLEELSHEIKPLQHHFIRLLSREIVRDRVVMLLLGSMTAEERVAAFLVNLSHRLGARGFSPYEFSLRMSREEIASYLGLKHETVTRAFSKFADEGLLSVHKKNIRINDLPALRRFMGHHR